MNTRLLATSLLAASLLGAPVIAYAQGESGPSTSSASTEGKSEAKPVHHHKMHTSHLRMKPGTTTGMSSRSAGQARPGGQAVARKPAAD